jgi:hypothetical protein
VAVIETIAVRSTLGVLVKNSLNLFNDPTVKKIGSGGQFVISGAQFLTCIKIRQFLLISELYLN